MVSRSVGSRLASAVVVLSLAAACGGERDTGSAADSNAVATARMDSAPAASPMDTAAAAAPDTSTKPSGAAPPTKDTAASAKPATPKPAAPKPTASTPAPTPKPAPAAAPKPAPARDTAAGAAPPVQAAQDTAKAPTQTAQAPSAQPTQDAPLRDQYHQAPRDTVTQVVYDGWKQYNLNCARCHGEDVLGTTIAPHLVVSLKPDGPINTKEAFVQVVCAGRPEKGMPAWCSLGLEMDKIDAIYGYVKGRSAGEIGPGRPAVKQGG